MFISRTFKNVDKLEGLLKEIEKEASDNNAIIDSFSIIQRTHDSGGNIFDSGAGAIIALATQVE